MRKLIAMLCKTAKRRRRKKWRNNYVRLGLSIKNTKRRNKR